METDMDLKERIATDPTVMVGKPVIKGSRLTVELILDLLASGWSNEEILANYPGIELDDIHACLAYAKEAMEHERVFPTPGV